MAKVFVEKTCDHCQKKMKVKPGYVLRGKGKYCSPECQYICMSYITHPKNKNRFTGFKQEALKD